MLVLTAALAAALQAAAPAALPQAPQAPTDTAVPVAVPRGEGAALTLPAGPRLIARFAPVELGRMAGVAPAAQPVPADTPQPRTRPQAVEHDQLYYTRLTIHRLGSYAIVPLFAGQYYVGQKLANGSGENLRGVHSALAVGVVGLFGLNTVTGVWNLYEARHDPEGGARRWLHSLTMLAADAGFAATAALTPEHEREGRFGGFFQESGGVSTATHRGIAIGSMGLATASTLMMWLWK